MTSWLKRILSTIATAYAWLHASLWRRKQYPGKLRIYVVSESIQVADAAPTRRVHRRRSLAESITVSGSVLRGVRASRRCEEAIGVNDAPDHRREVHITLNEQIQVAGDNMGLIVKLFKERGIITPDVPIVRAWNPGHYIRAGANDITGGFGANNSTDGVIGFQSSHPWSELEPVFDDYSALSSTGVIAKELQWCKDNSMRYVLMLVDRTFTGGVAASPVPKYFGTPAPAATPSANVYAQQYGSNQNGTGVMLARWNKSTTPGNTPGLDVNTRLKKLIDNIANLCDGHPNFEGLYFQETSGGLSDPQLNATDYSTVHYRDFYIDILSYAAAAMPASRIFWCLNFIPGDPGGGGGHAAEIAQAILAAVEPLNAIAFGGPDTLPETGGLRNDEYRYMAPDTTTFTINGVSCHGWRNRIPVAMQVSPPGYAIQWGGANPLPARYWTLQELYNFLKTTDSHAGNSLAASYVFWYAVNGSAGTADTDLGPPYNGWKGGAAFATPTGQTIVSQNHQIFNYTGPK